MESKGPLIVILAGMTIRTFRGKYSKYKISNYYACVPTDRLYKDKLLISLYYINAEKIHLSTCSASKIYLNLEIPEVSSFRNRFAAIYF